MLKLLFILVLMPSIAWPSYPDPVGSFCFTQYDASEKLESNPIESFITLGSAKLNEKQRADFGTLLQANAAAYEKKVAEMKRIELEILHFSFFRGYYIDTIQALCNQAAVINTQLAQQKLALNSELSKILTQQQENY
ncbi:MAG: hypothetical protein CTY29_05580 [Methylobacter sp.]|nr:MAG: hypothetical protein CTY29_05580 [Methylobacter sp.]